MLVQFLLAEENRLKRDLERQQLEKDNNDEDSDYEFEKSYKKTISCILIKLIVLS